MAFDLSGDLFDHLLKNLEADAVTTTGGYTCDVWSEYRNKANLRIAADSYLFGLMNGSLGWEQEIKQVFGTQMQQILITNGRMVK